MYKIDVLKQLNQLQKEKLLSLHDVEDIVNYGNILGIHIPYEIAIEMASQLSDEALESVVGGFHSPRQPARGPGMK